MYLPKDQRDSIVLEAFISSIKLNHSPAYPLCKIRGCSSLLRKDIYIIIDQLIDGLMDHGREVSESTHSTKLNLGSYLINNVSVQFSLARTILQCRRALFRCNRKRSRVPSTNFTQYAFLEAIGLRATYCKVRHTFLSNAEPPVSRF